MRDPGTLGAIATSLALRDAGARPYSWIVRWRRRRPYLGKFVAPEIHLAPIEELVGEGLLIAASGIRLAIKNKAILAILRHREDFDETRYLAFAQQQLRDLAMEKSAELEHLYAQWDSTDSHGLDEEDTETEIERLERRRRMLLGLISRLLELADDEVYPGELANAALIAAREEVAGAITASALRDSGPDDLVTGAERQMALLDLGAELDALLN